MLTQLVSSSITNVGGQLGSIPGGVGDAKLAAPINSSQTLLPCVPPLPRAQNCPVRPLPVRGLNTTAMHYCQQGKPQSGLAGACWVPSHRPEACKAQVFI